MISLRISCLLLAGATLMPSAEIPREIGQGWQPEFVLASRQILQLAEAIPADKYSWRPAKGVRSTSEVLMHIAIGNLGLLRQAKANVDLTGLDGKSEIKISGKEDVIRWLKRGNEAVLAAYPSRDGAQKITFLGQDATVDGVYLRILVHNHEHMGQLVAYARMMGVAPPWSKAAGE